MAVQEGAFRPAESVARRCRGRIATLIGWATTRLALDTLLLVCAGLAVEFASRRTATAHTPIGWTLLLGPVALLFLRQHGLYRRRLRVRILADVRGVVTSLSQAAFAVLILRVLLGDSAQAAHQMVRLWAFATAFLVVGRIAIDAREIAERRAGVRKPTLIIGAGKVGRLVAKRLRERPATGLELVGFLDPNPLELDNAADEPPILAWDDLDQLVAQHGIQHAIVTFCNVPHEVLLRMVKRCEQLDVDVSIVPRLFEQVTEHLEIEHLGGLPLVWVSRAPRPDGWRFALKYGLDRVLALVLLIVLSPLLAIGGLAVLATLGWPVLFRQQRLGRDGAIFEMLKLRTMSATEEDVGGDGWMLSRDTAPGGVEGIDRRTRLGKALRKTCIDELPQLVNVLKGEMSLVGPRPERPQFAQVFEHGVYRYGDRHRVKSGITGWAQIHGLRGQTSLSDRVEWDNFYIENWSLWVDAKILLMTLPTIWRYRRVTE